MVATDLSPHAALRRFFSIAASCCNSLSKSFSTHRCHNNIYTNCLHRKCVISLRHYVSSTKCDTERKSACQYPFANPKKMHENHVCTIHNMVCTHKTQLGWIQPFGTATRTSARRGFRETEYEPIHIRGSSTAGVGCIGISFGEGNPTAVVPHHRVC